MEEAALAKDLFYLASYKNVGKLFEKIETARAQEAFTTRFLAETIGLTSPNDRSLITMLKKMDFLDASGRPTEKYGLPSPGSGHHWHNVLMSKKRPHPCRRLNPARVG
jgi:hypothetical protein